MKLLQEGDTIVMTAYSINYSIGDTPFTYYLQVISCQISSMLYLASFAWMQFKYKAGLSFVLSHHSLFLLLYAVFIVCNCIVTVQNNYFNWGMLCGMFYFFSKQLMSTTVGYGSLILSIPFSSKLAYFYSFAFILFSFPFPIPFDVSYVQVGVMMLLCALFYFLLDNYLKQLVSFLAEKRMNDAKASGRDPADSMNVFYSLRQLGFSEFVLCALMTTLFESLLFIHSTSVLRKVLKGSIEVLQMACVYCYYLVMQKINSDSHNNSKEEHSLEGIELGVVEEASLEEEKDDEAEGEEGIEEDDEANE